MSGLKSVYEKYKAEITIGVVLFLVWKLWPLFSALSKVGGTVSDVVAGATANISDAAKKAQQRVAIKGINPNATDHDLEVFEAHATALAGFLGRLPGVWTNWAYPDRAGAFGIASKYSRILLEGHSPLAQPGSKGKVLAERKKSLQLAVLAPFYYSVTEGRNMIVDLDAAMSLPALDDLKTVYTKYVK
jgi:hypothetical protein